MKITIYLLFYSYFYKWNQTQYFLIYTHIWTYLILKVYLFTELVSSLRIPFTQHFLDKKKYSSLQNWQIFCSLLNGILFLKFKRKLYIYITRGDHNTFVLCEILSRLKREIIRALKCPCFSTFCPIHQLIWPTISQVSLTFQKFW